MGSSVVHLLWTVPRCGNTSRTSCITRSVCSLASRYSSAHFVRQVLNGKFCGEFSKIEEDLEKEGDANPLNQLYKKSEETELVQAEKRVRARLANLL